MRMPAQSAVETLVGRAWNFFTRRRLYGRLLSDPSHDPMLSGGSRLESELRKLPRQGIGMSGGQPPCPHHEPRR